MSWIAEPNDLLARVASYRATASGSVIFLILIIVVFVNATHLYASEATDLQFAQLAGSASQAAEIVRRSVGGKIISVTEQVVGGEVYYQVKTLLSGGRMKVVRVKARAANNS